MERSMEACIKVHMQQFDDGDTKKGPKRQRTRKRRLRHLKLCDASTTSTEAEAKRSKIEAKYAVGCASQSSPGKSSPPLQGKTVALSSALVHNNKAAETKIDADDLHEHSLSYKELVTLCHWAGAEVTGMVHKRVFCVIVTNVAATQHTQRVRKARKHGIPIVHVSWLEECLSKHKIVPFHHVDFDQSLEATDSTTSAVTTIAEEKHFPDRNEVEERMVDLGCCCVCHEQGSSATCDWCVDCNYKE